MASTPSSWIDKHTLNVVGGIIAVALIMNLITLTLALIFLKMPAENKDPFMLLLGGLLTQVSSIVAFFFGSSIGNRQQSETIATQAETVKTALATPLAAPDSNVQTVVLEADEKLQVQGSDVPTGAGPTIGPGPSTPDETKP